MIKIFLLLVMLSQTTFASTYARTQFGNGWIDADHDCQNTREEVLIAESLIPVIMDKPKCKVVSGKWYDPYSGKIFTNPLDLDIDHMVPLKAAWESGAYSWTKEHRISYANNLVYPNHLLAVSKSLNRQKGASSPELWMPPNKMYWDTYLGDWTYIKKTNNLSISSGEQKALILLSIEYNTYKNDVIMKFPPDRINQILNGAQ